jgi:hypothetical protein
MDTVKLIHLSGDLDQVLLISSNHSIDWQVIPEGHLRLLSSYFNSSALNQGIDSLLRGMAIQIQVKNKKIYFFLIKI